MIAYSTNGPSRTGFQLAFFLTKINSKQVKELNLKPQALKLLEKENIEDTFLREH